MSNDLFHKTLLLKTAVIRYPQFEQAYQKIITILELKKVTGISQHILCIGAAGTGKSTIKKEVEKAYPRGGDCGSPTIPVLTVDTPALPTVKNMAETMLLALGDPFAGKGTAENKTVRILYFLEKCKVQLIIFDELQHFIDQGKKNSPYQVSDWLKNLVDKANIPTVLMGLERSEQILQINEQLRRRFNQRIHLKPFDLNNQTDCKNFAGIVMKLQDLHNYPMNPCKLTPDFLEKLHYATNGIIDYIVKITLGSYQSAIEDGEIAITEKSFYKAFITHIWNDASDELNPFHEKFIKEPLTKLHMPFHVAGGYRAFK